MSTLTSPAGRVLIIESDDMHSLLLSKIVEECGHRPVIANNPNAAIDIINHQSPDDPFSLLITEMIFEISNQLDGFETARIIKKASPRVKIIFCFSPENLGYSLDVLKQVTPHIVEKGPCVVRRIMAIIKQELG